jgi:2,3-bisphosphoglycerate-dependent phosphoglycerate mutase
MKRGIHTLNIILDELDINWIKYKKHWRLNPQHFGSLQKMAKSEIIAKHGEEQYWKWAHCYHETPPLVDMADDNHPTNETKYVGIPAAALPCGESLKDCETRLESYWADKIAPVLLSGKNALVVSHRNTIRAFRKILGELDEKSVENAGVPPGIPRIYEFSQNLQIVHAYYLADDEEVKARLAGLKI